MLHIRFVRKWIRAILLVSAVLFLASINTDIANILQRRLNDISWRRQLQRSISSRHFELILPDDRLSSQSNKYSYDVRQIHEEGNKPSSLRPERDWSGRVVTLGSSLTKKFSNAREKTFRHVPRLKNSLELRVSTREEPVVLTSEAQLPKEKQLEIFNSLKLDRLKDASVNTNVPPDVEGKETGETLSDQIFSTRPPWITDIDGETATSDVNGLSDANRAMQMDDTANKNNVSPEETKSIRVSEKTLDLLNLYNGVEMTKRNSQKTNKDRLFEEEKSTVTLSTQASTIDIIKGKGIEPNAFHKSKSEEKMLFDRQENETIVKEVPLYTDTKVLEVSKSENYRGVDLPNFKAFGNPGDPGKVLNMICSFLGGNFIMNCR